ncbi:endolytic transglycosylase MltG [Parasediminibacterium sp. JCM 36343]|uniref:endolytic transglycosylase MltG n=1 Tax=Parasediminibacterium sp. JCM 36343 TaxID=3374279 RepID=UPI00397BB08D
MKKKIVAFLFAAFVLLVAVLYIFFAPATAFDEKAKSFIVEPDKNNKEDVVALLKEKYIIKNGWAFSLLASQLGVWDKLRPGKFEVRNGDNVLSIVRMLRRNRQVEVKLVINKLRTNEDLARLIGKNFSTDSAGVMQFLTSNDSLKPFSIDSNTVMTIVVPNTYAFYWSTGLAKIFTRIKKASDDFWGNGGRMQKATTMGFTSKEIYTIASIVEEETNKEEDKGKIASVYINRLHKGMNLGADPTIKFALKDFLLKRILFQHLTVLSPYNTYKNKGLPPGPICTPSTNTIDAVLNAPATDYIFFVAKPDFSGYSNFSSNFAQHSQYAKEYQQALNEYLSKKQQTEE